jgi:single-stranded DNA-binding protein
MTRDAHIKFHPYAEIFPLMEGQEFDDLVADIKARGLHEPIVIFRGQILDGRNRYRACIAAGIEWRSIPYTGDDPLGYVISLNLKRRHLSESQRAMVAAKLATLKLGDNQHSEGPSIEGSSKLLNVGHASVERAKVVQREGVPELVAAVEQGKVSVSAAAKIATETPEQQRAVVEAAKGIRAKWAEIKRNERIARIAEISNANAPLPQDRKYPILLADPPWTYEVYDEDSGSSRAAANHYPTMELAEICALPVAELSTPARGAKAFSAANETRPVRQRFPHDRYIERHYNDRAALRGAGHYCKLARNWLRGHRRRLCPRRSTRDQKTNGPPSLSRSSVALDEGGDEPARGRGTAMSIECAFYGFLARDADARLSQAGKPWVRLSIGVGKDDAVQWVNVAVFGKAAEKAAALKKSDRCYIEGTIKLDTWRGNDGTERHGLSVAAFKCEPTHRIGCNRPNRNTKEREFGTQPGANDGADFNDKIPF